MTALAEVYDLVALDLDGVVYVGSEPVRHASAALAELRAAGVHLAFITNNASRPPAEVARHLTDLGVPAAPGDVVTSAQAAARMLGTDLPARSRVFVIGGAGLEEALREEGLIPVGEIEDEPAAVVSGYAPDLPWQRVRDGAILVRRGLPWVATNLDATVPTAHGVGPGNGMLVGVVREFAGVVPRVAGKPERPLLEETLRRVGGDRPLMVGDRVDTDIEGAVNAGWDSLLVMTGVTDLAALVGLSGPQRPTYVAADLRGLQHALPDLRKPEAGASGWTASVEGGRLRVTGAGDANNWWAAVARAAWRHLDATGAPVSVSGVSPPEQ